MTSPAYNDPVHADKTEDELIDLTIPLLRARYGLLDTHEFYLIEDAAQRVRLSTIEGLYFRYAGKADIDGKQDGRDGAWTMDIDGLPQVDIVKARVVHMDYIRVARDTYLVRLDGELLKAIEDNDGLRQAELRIERQALRDLPATFDLEPFTTPTSLRAAWPIELPAR